MLRHQAETGHGDPYQSRISMAYKSRIRRPLGLRNLIDPAIAGLWPAYIKYLFIFISMVLLYIPYGI